MHHDRLVFQTLGSRGYWAVPKGLLLYCQGDGNLAVSLAYLIDQYLYHSERPGYRGRFYVTMVDMTRYTGITGKVQRRVFQDLIDGNWINVRVFGTPPKRWIKLNTRKIKAACETEVNLVEGESVGEDFPEEDDFPEEVANSGEFSNLPKVEPILDDSVEEVANSAGISNLSQRDKLNLTKGTNQIFANAKCPKGTNQFSPKGQIDLSQRDKSYTTNPDLTNPELPSTEKQPIHGASQISKDAVKVNPPRRLSLFEAPMGGNCPEGFLELLAEQAPTLITAPSGRETKSKEEAIRLLTLIRNHAFLSSIRWDAQWLSGAHLRLTSLPGITNTGAPLSWRMVHDVVVRSFKSYLAHNPADPATTPPSGTKVPLAAWLVDSARPKEGARSHFLRYLLHNPTEVGNEAVAAIRAGIDPAAARYGDLILKDREDRGGSPWNPKGQLAYWMRIRDLCTWHADHLDTLLAIQPLHHGPISTPGAFIRLLREFLQTELIDLWFDRMVTPGGYGWKQFMGWAKLQEAPVVLDILSVTREEAEQARERVRKMEWDLKVKAEAERMIRVHLEAEGYVMPMAEALEIAAENLTP